MDGLIDLTPMIVVILSVVITALTTRGIQMLRDRMDQEQQEMLRAWVHIAVYAAEKLYGAGRGAEKLAYAKKLLEEQGFTLDVDTLEAMVNAEIQEMLTRV
ncbi:MAG: hypothetical protein IJ088_06575 [Clostridia bacterium]|nr:hypothetical protein [Clostridia bacterium]